MYRVKILPNAVHDISSLDSSVARRILRKLNYLQNNIDKINLLPLGGNFRGFYKLRTGDWRIIYDVDYKNKLIFIHKIGHRSKIYK